MSEPHVMKTRYITCIIVFLKCPSLLLLEMASRRPHNPGGSLRSRTPNPSFSNTHAKSQITEKERERKVANVSASVTTTASGDDGASIQVAIRCRRRSQKEVDEKSPVIVSTAPSAITVETSTSTSTFGVISLPPTRTYPFDDILGPEVDQASVYTAVVAPMLEEVLLGYNCTLFAYGQTGTGKT
jgi:kinesin family protein 11